MKYKEGDILYYVNPFIFIIDKVKIEMGIIEEGELFYIDDIGAYLRENDLFEDLSDAQNYAIQKLEIFAFECRRNILNTKPEYFKEQ